MKLQTWIFPESGGIIPGIAGTFHGNLKVTVDEDTMTVQKVEVLNTSVTSALITIPEETQEIVTPGYTFSEEEASEITES